jgi:hypothetical protein
VYLGCWNTELVSDGTYYLKLSALDSADNLRSTDIWVVVDNEEEDGGSSCRGPQGGGTSMAEGSVLVGSATGYLLHLSEDLDSLNCERVGDSSSYAVISAILTLGNDSVLLGDSRNHTLSKLARAGLRGRTVAGNLGLPEGLARDATGNIWLVDRSTSRIAKLRPNGTPVFTRGGYGRDPGELAYPEAIATKDSFVYVADTRNNRVAVWDTLGNYSRAITGDFSLPQALIVTDSGNLYVTDLGARRIQGISTTGDRFYTISTPDSATLKYLCPSRNRHTIYTLNTTRNRVQKHRIKSDDSMPGGQQGGELQLPRAFCLYQPWPNPSRQSFHVRYAVPQPTRVSLKLYDICGREQRTLVSEQQKPGYYSIVWNGRDNQNRTCSQGIYFIQMQTDSYRSQKKVVLAR